MAVNMRQQAYSLSMRPVIDLVFPSQPRCDLNEMHLPRMYHTQGTVMLV